MSVIPPNTTTEQDLAAWFTAKKELERVKASEMLLRMKLFGHYFPSPVEGTNTVELPSVQGVRYALKAVYPITRKIDDPVLTTAAGMLREKGVPVDSLVVRKPELVLSEYRTLTAEQRALFDQVMEIKPGTPALTISQIKKG
jgi:hypothetical protein